MRISLVSASLVFSAVLVVTGSSCGGGGGGAGGGGAGGEGGESTVTDTATDTGSDTGSGTTTDTGTDTGNDCAGAALGDAPPPPSANLQTGVLAISTPDDVDPASLEGFVVGQEDKELFRASDCKYYIAGVEPGEADVILMAGSVAVPALTGATPEGKDRGVRIPVTFEANKVLDGGKPTVPLAGRMKGKVVKSDGGNALGTAVFLPGVQFANLLSAADGSYDFSFLPVGKHQFAFTADGYNDGFLTVEIESDKEYAAPDVTLVVSTLDVNEVLLNGGDSTSPSYTVNVLLATGPDAITMRVGETEALTGVSSEPVSNAFEYTCKSTFMTGQDVTCKVCVAVENADGSEVSNCDTILIDLFAIDGQLFTPDFTIPASVKASSPSFDVTNISPNPAATEMAFKHGQFLTWLPEAINTDTTLTVSPHPDNCGTYSVSMKLKNLDGAESTEKTKTLGVKCWDALPTSAAPVARGSHAMYFTGATGNSATENRVIVYGGKNTGGTDLETGAFYNVATKSWTAMATSGAPTTSSGSMRSALVGSELFAWSNVNESGGLLDLATNTWTAIDTTDPDSPPSNAPVALQYEQEAVGAGSKVVLWGGIANGTYVNTGYVLTVAGAAGSNWIHMNTANAPAGRSNFASVYTGATGDADTADRVIVYGGETGGTAMKSGGVYHVDTDTWSVMPDSPLSGTYRACAVWTGATGNSDTSNRMLVFGGEGSGGFGGALYDPKTNQWSAAIADGGFGATTRSVSCAWTGKYLFVVTPDAPGATKGGGLYDPATDTWYEIGQEADLVDANNPFTRQMGAAVALGDGSVFYWGGKTTTGGIDALGNGYTYYPWAR